MDEKIELKITKTQAAVLHAFVFAFLGDSELTAKAKAATYSLIKKLEPYSDTVWK